MPIRLRSSTPSANREEKLHKEDGTIRFTFLAEALVLKEILEKHSDDNVNSVTNTWRSTRRGLMPR
jgi:hypothetical protein